MPKVGCFMLFSPNDPQYIPNVHQDNNKIIKHSCWQTYRVWYETHRWKPRKVWAPAPCDLTQPGGDLMRGHHWQPPVRHVGHFKLQKMLWPMKTATVCHHSDSYCLYILKWKSSYFLKKKTFLWLHLGLHHGSIIRIIQVGSYSISSSSAWKSQKKRSETSRSTDYLSKKLWLYPIRPYVVCCCML
jgi:hypothetical protein